MTVTISHKLRQYPALAGLAEAATDVIRQEFPPDNTHDLRLNWDMNVDAGSLRPQLMLSVRDGTSCEASFHVSDVHDVQRLRDRFRTCCGNVIAAHN
jgi:hypothetical protein